MDQKNQMIIISHNKSQKRIKNPNKDQKPESMSRNHKANTLK